MSWDSPGWQGAAQDYHAERLKNGWSITKPRLPWNWHRMSLGGLWHALNDPKRRGKPEVIVDAIVHAVRARGADALKEPAILARLGECDEAAKAQINARLSKLGVRHG
jgi:hypothetical protein